MQDRWSPLHIACANDHTACAKLLIDNKANVNDKGQVSAHTNTKICANINSSYFFSVYMQLCMCNILIQWCCIALCILCCVMFICSMIGPLCIHHVILVVQPVWNCWSIVRQISTLWTRYEHIHILMILIFLCT